MQIIDYHALTQNVLYFKNMLKSSKLCAVIKNNAYGHGLERTASCLAPFVDCFAVGNAEECSKIAYLNKDVLILLPQNEAKTKLAIEFGGILTVDSFSTLAIIQSVAESLNKTVSAHIKIDSGMSRLGFTYNDIPLLIEELKRCENVSITGVFSHFWGDTIESCDSQFIYFTNCTTKLENDLNVILTKHIANTSGALLSDKYHLDMARIGIGLFGYGADELTPCKTVKANVISVKNVKQGDVVGYGGLYACKKDTKIAVIDTGYALGLSKTLTGEKIKINGKLYPIVAICMAMSMVDVGQDNVNVGDVATLLGDGVNIANDKVITYELLCNLR